MNAGQPVKRNRTAQQRSNPVTAVPLTKVHQWREGDVLIPEVKAETIQLVTVADEVVAQGRGEPLTGRLRG
jgi:hypothetical protein